jgi:hypothetical protein
MQTAAVHLLLLLLPRVILSPSLALFPSPLSPFARATAAGALLGRHLTVAVESPQ